MSAKNKFHQQFSEDKFKSGQRKAAELLVQKEFASKDEAMTNDELSEAAGVCRKTLYSWEYFDENFIAYKNYLASQFMDSHLSYVYKKLLEGIGNGSQKGIDTFLKRIGDLDTNSDVTVHQGNSGGDLSQEERLAQLKERMEKQQSEGSE